MKIINKHIYADISEKDVETQYTFKSDPHYHTEYEETYFKNNDSLGDSLVKFYTYQLVTNKEVIGYIWWNEETVYINDGHRMEFKFNSKPIINGFVKNIKVKKWVDTFSLSDIIYCGFTDKLSDLVKTVDNNEKHWRFELIENK